MRTSAKRQAGCLCGAYTVVQQKGIVQSIPASHDLITFVIKLQWRSTQYPECLWTSQLEDQGTRSEKI